MFWVMLIVPPLYFLIRRLEDMVSRRRSISMIASPAIGDEAGSTLVWRSVRAPTASLAFALTRFGIGMIELFWDGPIAPFTSSWVPPLGLALWGLVGIARHLLAEVIVTNGRLVVYNWAASATQPISDVVSLGASAGRVAFIIRSGEKLAVPFRHPELRREIERRMADVGAYLADDGELPNPTLGQTL